MLIRIVRMSFKPNEVEKFFLIFNEAKEQIRNFPGCLHLELWRDFHHEHIYFTYSHWEDDNALEVYRKSDLFQEAWKKTRVLFLDKPTAFSLKKEQEV